MSRAPTRPSRLNKLPAASKTYLKFLDMVQALREGSQFPSLDPLEERLLSQLATLWGNEERVTVLEAMAMSSDASARTVHRRIKSLQAKGIIELAPDPEDSRVKYVVPTRQATRYFDKLGQILRDSTRR